MLRTVPATLPIGNAAIQASGVNAAPARTVVLGAGICFGRACFEDFDLWLTPLFFRHGSLLNPMSTQVIFVTDCAD
jgi:hypothetical protein